MTKAQKASMQAEIRKQYHSPERVAFRQALEVGNLNAIKALWFDSYSRFYDLNVADNRFTKDFFDKSYLWLLCPFHDDRTLKRTVNDQSRMIKKFKGNFLLKLYPMFLASPLEVALHQGNRNLFDEMCALLNEGKYERQEVSLKESWSLATMMFYCNFDELLSDGGLQVESLDGVFGSIFGLAFLSDNAQAYMALLCAGFDDSDFVDSARELMLDCRESKSGVFDQINKILAKRGYRGRTMDEWFKFIDFRWNATNQLKNALWNYECADEAARLKAMDLVNAVLPSSCPGTLGLALAQATAANDITLVTRLFEAGAHPNGIRDVGQPWFARLCADMSVEMFAAWLDAGANPMMVDSRSQYDGNLWQSALCTCVWAGRADLVSLCLFNARKPLEIEWTQKCEDGTIKVVHPFEELSELALSRVSKAPDKKLAFDTIASLLSCEPGRQKANCCSDELATEIKQAPSGGPTITL